MKIILSIGFLVSRILQRLTFVPVLLTRLGVGFVFLGSGWGKLHHLDKTIEFFSSIGIPGARYQAPFVGGMEFLCGAFILIGFATRLASIPLIVIMVVAIRTAKWGDITSISSLFEITEGLYLILLTWLATYGAGAFSVDAVLDGFRGRKKSG